MATAETLAEMHDEAIEFGACPKRPAGKAKQAMIDSEKRKAVSAAESDRLAGEITALARVETLPLLGEDGSLADLL